MTDKEPNHNEEINQTDLQEQYLKSLEELEEGQLVEGKVVQIGDDQVFVDVGYKSEGRIPITEFKNKPVVGDKVSVVLVKKEDRSGEIVVSKSKADIKLFWKDLRQAFQDGKPIEATFSKAIKGGFEVDLGYGITGFNPISKTDVVRVNNPEEYVGMKSLFTIDRLYSENKLKIVLSRRDWLEKEIERKREEFFNTVSIDDVVEGTVKSFTSFGAFIDLGGFDGLLHINDMSWGHVTRPKDYVKKGQKLQFKVISWIRRRERSTSHSSTSSLSLVHIRGSLPGRRSC
jgi:small subunit ribosomal protein S1